MQYRVAGVLTNTVAGTNVASKNDAQSAEPCLVGNALATTARRQSFLLQVSVLEAAPATWTPYKKAVKERRMMKSSENNLFDW